MGRSPAMHVVSLPPYSHTIISRVVKYQNAGKKSVVQIVSDGENANINVDAASQIESRSLHVGESRSFSPSALSAELRKGNFSRAPMVNFNFMKSRGTYCGKLANMAPFKRKSEAAGPGSSRPEKKPKPSSGRSLSVLKEDAPFPRGGASVLTPLEHKQIKIQAKQDVLFEQTTGTKAPRKDFEDEDDKELSDGEPNAAVETKSRKRKGAHKIKNRASTIQEKAFRIESLSYKVCSCM